LFFVERAVRIDLDLDAAFRQLLGFGFEEFGGFALGCIDGDDMAELDDDGLLCPGAGSREQTEGEQGDTAHGRSPSEWW